MRDLTLAEVQTVSAGSVLEGGDGWLGFSWEESAGIIMGLGSAGGPGLFVFGACIGMSMLLATPDDTEGGSSG